MINVSSSPVGGGGGGERVEVEARRPSGPLEASSRGPGPRAGSVVLQARPLGTDFKCSPFSSRASGPKDEDPASSGGLDLWLRTRPLAED